MLLVGKARPKKASGQSNPVPRRSPEDTTFDMPLGHAMACFYIGAGFKDERCKNKMYEALAATIRNRPAGVTKRHVGMAVLELAKDVLLAELLRWRKGEVI